MAEVTGIRTIAPQKKPRRVVERNLALFGEVMQYLLDKPQIIESLPDNFELVILPDDDPALRRYNLELLETLDAGDKPVVFVRLKSARAAISSQPRPSLYVPLAA
jgi:hypothetical protein